MPVNASDFAGTVTVADGAWGTQLDQRGCPAGYCREEWNTSHPERVESVAADYVAAGAQVILTNTFTANRLALARHGFGDRVAEFNRAGAAISRKAAGKNALVFGSMGPSGKIVMMGETSEEELYEVFREQAVALAEGGADGIVAETMTELAEVLAAVSAAKENTALPVVASMTFDSGPDRSRTIMGVAAAEAARELTDAGADIIGCNCGIGIESYMNVVGLLRAGTDRPIWVKANAGIPEVEGGQAVYRQTPEEFASFVPQLIQRGANIIGGCCGTTPETIRAVRKVVDKMDR